MAPQDDLTVERAAVEYVARKLARIVKLPNGEYGVRINQRTYTFISEEAAIIEREWWVDFFVSAIKTARQEALWPHGKMSTSNDDGNN